VEQYGDPVIQLLQPCPRSTFCVRASRPGRMRRMHAPSQQPPPNHPVSGVLCLVDVFVQRTYSQYRPRTAGAIRVLRGLSAQPTAVPSQPSGFLRASEVAPMVLLHVLDLAGKAVQPTAVRLYNIRISLY
jgi:hypothetical protein